MVSELEVKAKYLRKTAFETVIKAGKGHLGGSLSSVEILVALYYGGILKYDVQNPKWEDRDRFILSKGHANNVLHVVLADLGFYPKTELDSYTKDGCVLGGHCDPNVPGIEIVSGSLGHGLGIGCGIALGARLDNKDFMTYVLLGDGECQEGSVWEAISFASHHNLNNLVAIVDRNGLGAEEFTESTCQLEPLANRWSAFGWEAFTVQGHNIPVLIWALKNKSDRPKVIIANTIKGKGISELENKPKAHHTLPTDVEMARKELGW
jgi:transketolase